MAAKKKPRSDDLGNVEKSPEVRTTRGLKPGPQALRGRIETLVADQRLKRMMYRQELATDKLITDGKGGEKLEQFSTDYSQNYKFSVRESERKKKVNNPSSKNSNVLLRQVSEMEEFK